MANTNVEMKWFIDTRARAHITWNYAQLHNVHASMQIDYPPHIIYCDDYNVSYTCS